MTRKIILFTVLMSLVGIKITFSQEWQFSIESDTLEGYGFTSNVTELSNGNLLMPCNHAFRYNPHEHATICPSIILLSKDGKELARNDFFRPGYCLMSHGQAFEKNNSLYYLTTYTPEHTQNCFNNHFENSDNPPSDGKLVLMKLDDQLNMEECYEHSWPVDTYEDHGGIWEIYPNGFSGNIYLFTAFEEDDNIVGAYWKSVSYDSPSRGNDTLFFFRMNFDGEMLLKKVAKVDVGKGNRYLAEEESANDRGLKTNYFRGDHFVSTDYGYIFYVKGDGAPNNSYLGAGRAMYYDKDFNLLRTRYVKFNNPYHGETIGDFNVCRSNHNTTYLSSQMRSPDDPSGDEDCCLYELDDDIDAESNWIDNINYIHRKTDEWDQPSFLSSVDLIDDNSLCYVYELYEGLGGNLDSYLVIEHLDNNLDTISTFYYGVDNRMQERVYCIKRVSDGVIIIHDKTALDIDYFSSCITKFPATAFGFEPDNIEEAHAHNLHLAVAYPNPGGDVLNIRTGLRNATLQVYDMQGRIIH
ncbi:MAG: T9SS type A sorting domain-containing protein, partial [Bacteroidales bacterium]|nr:T9SS type A sorting domain-containing protein [Bacteroidales bacterium]